MSLQKSTIHLRHEALLAYIRNELEYRKLGNKAYSLRAFARDLGISPSFLSELLRGRANVSRKKSRQLLLALNISDQDLSYLEKQLASCTRVQKKVTTLEQEQFKAIADWQHFALLNVLRLDDCDGSVEYLSQRLGISQKLTRNSLERLQVLGLVKKRENKYVCSSENVQTTTNISSQALRASHKQTLEQGKLALDNIPVNLRDITSMTMAIDIEKLDLAKKLIRDFRLNLCELLEGGKRNSVYNLNIQLHPLTIEKEN